MRQAPKAAAIARLSHAATLLLLTCTLYGCVSKDTFLFGRDKVPVAGPKNPVVQVLGMWQPGTGPGIDGKTTRGFAGQIFFFTSDSAIAAKVRGEVSIYVFDDQGTPEEQIKPIHKFRYEADSWELLGHAGKLGQAYSVFVPYTRPGFHKALCSLKVKFVPEKGGATVYSDMASLGLPGKKQKTEAEGDGSEAEDDDSSEELEDGSHELTRKAASGSSSTASPSLLAKDLTSIDLSQFRRPAGAPPAVALDDRERSRIMQNVRGRGEEFSQEQSSKRVASREVRNGWGQDGIVQASHLKATDDESDWDQDDVPETRPARLSPEAARGAKPAQSVLADFDEDE